MLNHALVGGSTIRWWSVAAESSTDALKLEAKLISPNPDDGRSSTIELTRAGRRLLVAARRTFTDEVDIRLGEPLSTSELQRFAATVHKLRTHIHEHRGSA